MSERAYELSMDARVRELEKWGQMMNGSVKRLADEQTRIANVVENRIAPAVDLLVKKDEIASAVKAAVREQSSRRWTRRERWLFVLGGLTALVAAAAAVAGLIVK